MALLTSVTSLVTESALCVCGSLSSFCQLLRGSVGGCLRLPELKDRTRQGPLISSNMAWPVGRGSGEGELPSQSLMLLRPRGHIGLFSP